MLDQQNIVSLFRTAEKLSKQAFEMHSGLYLISLISDKQRIGRTPPLFGNWYSDSQTVCGCLQTSDRRLGNSVESSFVCYRPHRFCIFLSKTEENIVVRWTFCWTRKTVQFSTHKEVSVNDFIEGSSPDRLCSNRFSTNRTYMSIISYKCLL